MAAAAIKALTRGRTDHLSTKITRQVATPPRNVYPYCWKWNILHDVIFDNDLDKVTMKHQAKCPVQRSYRSKVIVPTHAHTHRTDCSTWTTTKV